MKKNQTSPSHAPESLVRSYPGAQGTSEGLASGGILVGTGSGPWGMRFVLQWGVLGGGVGWGMRFVLQWGVPGGGVGGVLGGGVGTEPLGILDEDRQRKDPSVLMQREPSGQGDERHSLISAHVMG